MILALLACLTLAWAQPGPEVLRQQQAVEAAAEAVARARAEGARRAEVAERMRVYREAAEALAALRAPDAAGLEAERRERLQAMTDLAEAIAEGRNDRGAAEVLGTWLGTPTDRLGALQAGLMAADAMPEELRQAVLLDVSEQAAALSVKLTYDALAFHAEADQKALRALALRRQGPGSSNTLGTEVDAQRLETEAAAARAAEAALLALRPALDDLRGRLPERMESP